MRTKRELMTEILETAVIESVKSDCEVVHYDVEVHEEMHRLQVITGQFVVEFYHLEDEDSDYSSSCPHLVCTFSPWEIEEALDTFFMMDGETGELHVDESKIELGIDSDFTPEAKPEITREDIEEAKREAQIEMLHRIKTYSLSVSFENAKNLNKTGNCFYDGKIEAYKDINEMCEALLYRLGEED